MAGTTPDDVHARLARIVTPARHSLEDPEPAAFARHVLCGRAQHAFAADQLVALGVTAVLNCSPAGAHDCRSMYTARNIAYRALAGCEDIAGYDLLGIHLAEAQSFVEEHTSGERSGGRVLVHCFAGANRSATIAIACLLKTTREPLLPLVERCFALRPFILKNESFRRQLVALCHREGIPATGPPPAAGGGGGGRLGPALGLKGGAGGGGDSGTLGFPRPAPPSPATQDAPGEVAAAAGEATGPAAAAPEATGATEAALVAASTTVGAAGSAAERSPASLDAGPVAEAAGAEEPTKAAEAEEDPPQAPPSEAARPYTLGEKLGQGAFATVYACRLEGVDETLAAKVVLRSRWIWIGGRSTSGSVAVDSVRNEVQALERLGSHPNIVRCFGLRSEPECEVLLMECASGGDLARTALAHEHGMAPKDVRHYMRGLLRALAHCHACGVAHRDVKLENLLLAGGVPATERCEPEGLEKDRGTALHHGTGPEVLDASALKTTEARAVLSDFGHAALLHAEGCKCGGPRARLHDRCGTKAWCAPEILSCGAEGYLGPPVDLWSAGVCMFAMLTGKMPFEVADPLADPRFARATDVQAKGGSSGAMLLGWLGAADPLRWSDEAVALLDSLLCIDPAARASAREAFASLWLLGTEEEPAAARAANPLEPPSLGLLGGGTADWTSGWGARAAKREANSAGRSEGKAPRTTSYMAAGLTQQAHEERTCVWRGMRTDTRADVLRGVAVGAPHAAYHPTHTAECDSRQRGPGQGPPGAGSPGAARSEWLREENAHGAILPTIGLVADRPFKVGLDNNNNYRWRGGDGPSEQAMVNGGYPR